MAAEAEDAREDRGDLERMESAHRLIFGLLRDLDAADEPGQICKLLDGLAGLLPGHFADEEGPTGLFEELRAARVANHSRLEAFGREHPEILQAIEELRRSARELERALDRLRQDKLALVRKVQSHEQAETGLFIDTYLVDEGGRG